MYPAPFYFGFEMALYPFICNKSRQFTIMVPDPIFRIKWIRYLLLEITIAAKAAPTGF